MPGTHSKLWYRNDFSHWRYLDLVLDLNNFLFLTLTKKTTHLLKHESLSPNHQFCQGIWYVEYYSVHDHMAWSQKFRKSEMSLDTE